MGQVCRGAKRRGFQTGTRLLNPSFYFMLQGFNALLYCVYGSPGCSEESRVIFSLADQVLCGKVCALATTLGLDGLLLRSLNHLKMVLNSPGFTGFNCAVRRVGCAPDRFNENCINTQPRAFRANTRDHITNGDRSPVRTRPEMPGSYRIFANLVEDLPLAFPGLKQRSGLHSNRPGKRRFPFEHQCPVDSLILKHFLDSLQDVIYRRRELGNQTRIRCVAVAGCDTPNPGLVTELSRSEEHTSELQSRLHLVCRLLLEKKKDLTLCYSF